MGHPEMMMLIQTTATSIGVKPEIWPRMVSVDLTGPTPSGVPLKIKSPGCNSNKVDRFAMVSLTDQIR